MVSGELSHKNAECKSVHAVSCSVMNDIIHIRTTAYSIQPICVYVSITGGHLYI